MKDRIYFCEICKKIFSLANQLNGHKRTHILSKQHESYLKAPKNCKECSVDIPWKLIRTKPTAQFCSKSCRAKYFKKVGIFCK